MSHPLCSFNLEILNTYVAYIKKCKRLVLTLIVLGVGESYEFQVLVILKQSQYVQYTSNV
jgi:hypothetical protein